MKLMIFSGTTEGHDLCRFLSKNNVQAEVFVATEYGAAVMEPMAGITVHEGRLDEREMEKRLTSAHRCNASVRGGCDRQSAGGLREIGRTL